MASLVMASPVMASPVMASPVMASLVMASLVMASLVMAGTAITAPRPKDPTVAPKTPILGFGFQSNQTFPFSAWI